MPYSADTHKRGELKDSLMQILDTKEPLGNNDSHRKASFGPRALHDFKSTMAVVPE